MWFLYVKETAHTVYHCCICFQAWLMQTQLRNFGSQNILKIKKQINKGTSKSRSMQTQLTNISSQNILGIVLKRC